LDHIFCGWFNDLGDYGRDRDRDHGIDNDDFRGFVGRTDLFDDFLLIMASYADCFDITYKHVMKFRSYRKLSYNLTAQMIYSSERRLMIDGKR